jgi:hypothetical protein
MIRGVFMKPFEQRPDKLTEQQTYMGQPLNVHVHPEKKGLPFVPNFLRNKMIGSAAVLATMAIAIGGGYEALKGDLPHHQVAVEPSPSLLTAVSWPEAVEVDSGSASKVIRIEKSWGGNVPLFGSILKKVDEYPVYNGVAGETQVLLEPKPHDGSPTTMQWYKARTITGKNGKRHIEWGVKEEVSYSQLRVQEAAVNCKKQSDQQCIAGVQKSIISEIATYAPLVLAATPLKFLGLAGRLPVVGGIFVGIHDILGNQANIPNETDDLYDDAEQDMGSECGQLLTDEQPLAYGLGKDTKIELMQMANLDKSSTSPALKAAANIYETASQLPVLVELTGTQTTRDKIIPQEVTTSTFAKQFGTQVNQVSLKDGASCTPDSTASNELSSAMRTLTIHERAIMVSNKAAEGHS